MHLHARRYFRPALQELEPRHLLRATGIQFLSPPRLGTRQAVQLIESAEPGLYTVATTWSYQTAYGGFTSPTHQIESPDVAGAVIPAVIPGTLTVFAVVSYQTSYPNGNPVQPNTVFASIYLNPPDTVTKGGAIGVPIALGSTAQLSLAVTAAGQPIGQYANGSVLELLSEIDYTNDNKVAADPDFGPLDPSESFYFNPRTSTIIDQQMPIANGDAWNDFADGKSVLKQPFTQQLEYVWSMSTTLQTNQPFSVCLTTLSWNWSRIDATHWRVD